MMKPRRPFSVTLLAVLVLTVAAFNLIRMAQTFVAWDFLVGLMRISPSYLAVSGLLWGVPGLLLAIGIWRGARRAPGLTRLALPAYTLFYWLDRLILSGHPERNVNWPFAAGANLFILLWSYWILSRKRVKIFFGEAHE